MIAKIIPIKKMPRGLNLFDYSVPLELENTIEVGQLVEIPFRKSLLFGLVFDISDPAKSKISSSERDPDQIGIKPIISLKFLIPLVRVQTMLMWEKMSAWYGVSMGFIANMHLPPMQKNKLKKIHLTPLLALGAKNTNQKHAVYIYKNQLEHQKILNLPAGRQGSNTHGTTLILVPEVCLIAEVQNLLDSEQKDRSCVWHAHLSVKEQFTTWWQIRNGEKNIIIGTRSAAFLPFPKLDTIILDYEHDENHKHWDQSPRYHTKDIVELLHSVYGATINLASFSPSVRSYFEIHKNISVLKTEKWPQNNPINNLKIIDMLDERRAGRYGIFADEVEQALLKAKKNIFILVERLGLATSIGCNDCGRMEACTRCGTPLVYHDDNTMHCHYCHTIQPKPTICSNCRSPVTILRGAGTETVEAQVRKLFSYKKTHSIYRVDSEQEDSYASTIPTSGNTATVLIGTSMALKYVDWKNTELIVFTDPDKRLAWPEFSAGENCWQLVEQILFRREENCSIYLQTRHPTGSFYKSIFEPDRFYRLDLNARQRLNYPPYCYLVRYLFCDENKIVATREANILFNKLQISLTKEKKSLILQDPIEATPPFYRGRYWQVITCRLPMNSWQVDLPWLNNQIPAKWKIDPNPNSLLSL